MIRFMKLFAHVVAALAAVLVFVPAASAADPVTITQTAGPAPGSVTVDDRPRFTFAIKGAHTRLYRTRDGSMRSMLITSGSTYAYAPWASPNAPLSEGPHSITLEAGNSKGEILGTITVAFTVSIPAPVIETLQVPSPTGDLNQTPTFDFRVTDTEPHKIRSMRLYVGARSVTLISSSNGHYRASSAIPTVYQAGTYQWKATATSSSGKKTELTGQFVVTGSSKGLSMKMKRVPYFVLDLRPLFTAEIDDQNYSVRSVRALVDGLEVPVGGASTRYTFTTPANVTSGVHTWQMIVTSASGQQAVSGGSFQPSPGAANYGTPSITPPSVLIKAPGGKIVKSGLVLLPVKVLSAAGKPLAAQRVICRRGLAVVVSASTNKDGVAVCKIRAASSTNIRVTSGVARPRIVRLTVR